MATTHLSPYLIQALCPGAGRVTKRVSSTARPRDENQSDSEVDEYDPVGS